MKLLNGLLLGVPLVLSTSVNAQTDLDSLYAIWQDDSLPDSTRVNAYSDHIWKGYLFSRPDTAEVLAEALHTYANEQGFSEASAIGYNLQGIANAVQGNNSHALEYFQRSLVIQEEIGDREATANSLDNIGNIHQRQGNYPQALEYLQQALSIREKIGDKAGIATNMDKLGIVYLQQANYPRALEYFQNALTIQKEIGNTDGMPGILNNIGNLYSSQGNFPHALENYQRSLAISEENGNERTIAACLTNIGIIYNEQGDHNLAREYYQKALVIGERVMDKKSIAVNQNNIGNTYYDQGNYLHALEYFQKSLTIREEIGDKHGVSACLNNIGRVYKEQGDHPRALEYHQKSLAIREEIGSKRFIATSLIDIGKVYSKEGKYHLTLDYCQRGLQMAEEIDVLQYQKDACQCLYEGYKAMGNSRKALEYLEHFEIIEDSLNETETAKKLQRFEFDKELLADSLRQEEEKHAIELAHQEEVAEKDKTRNMLMGGALLLLLVAGGLFSRNRYVNRSKKQIQKEKDRSEELLLNILPEEVAEELKANGEAEAKLIDQVTVLFTDFKGFTAMSETLSPKELVRDLHECFSAFDNICEKHGLEKIKTIGDAYMAAGGLPVPNDTHAVDTVRAALEIRDFIAEGKARKIAAGLPYFEIRIGIHTGPVVAGIVGVKKFSYDIWGDT
ncbi:MAG: tetratricopeptide repeat protein, partial [Flavobacteriales bacterium]|nr:tetratricopeptide repeat protein [Flavobacteriales bacterium]